MNISVFSSEKFAPLLKVMLLSFCETNNFEKHNIFIITTDMSDETESKINKVIETKFKQHVQKVVIDGGSENGFIDNKGFSAASYHKLYAFRMLPQTVDRLLCLDADMIVKKSLKNFYYQDMEGKALCACLDCHVSQKDRLDIGLDAKDQYVNLGCLLIDMKKFLNEYSVEEYVKWAAIWKPKYVAQDVVNALFHNKIKIASKIYNYQIFSCQMIQEIEANELVYRQLGKLNKKQLNFVQDEVAILHYIGGIKPNNFRFISKTAKYFYAVMARNGMKKDVVKLIFLNLLFRVKKFLKGE